MRCARTLVTTWKVEYRNGNLMCFFFLFMSLIEICFREEGCVNAAMNALLSSTVTHPITPFSAHPPTARAINEACLALLQCTYAHYTALIHLSSLCLPNLDHSGTSGSDAITPLEALYSKRREALKSV